MFLRTYVLTSISMLASCSNVMPGMQNPDISQMQNNTIINTQSLITPKLIPITPSLLADENISKYIYRIAPADVLNISIWQHPEFSSPDFHTNQNINLPSKQGASGSEGYLVNPDGYIYFPLVGNVRVAGKTVDEIRYKLTLRLEKYIKNPELNVRVVDFRGRKVYVLGEVNKTGFIPLNDQPLSITDAIVLRGGLDPNAADPSHIYVIRGKIDNPYVYWLNAKTPDALLLAEHFHLQPNDILFVSSASATRWNRVLGQLLPTIQTIWYTKSIVNSSS